MCGIDYLTHSAATFENSRVAEPGRCTGNGRCPVVDPELVIEAAFGMKKRRVDRQAGACGSRGAPIDTSRASGVSRRLARRPNPRR